VVLFLIVAIVEWELTQKKHVHEAAKTVNVSIGPIRLIAHHFRGHVAGGTYVGLRGRLRGRKLGSAPEIGEFEGASAIGYQNVLKFNVAVDYPALMQRLKRLAYLGYNGLHLLLLKVEAALLDKVVEEGALWHVFHDDAMV